MASGDRASKQPGAEDETAMEMHQLTYFVRAAELGGFTKAAEECFVSQPSLSQAIARLEQELGRPLFDRLGRKIALTDAGRLLLENARQILNLAEDAKHRIAEAGNAGRVRLAAIPTIAPYFLPPLLQAFGHINQQTVVEVHEEVTETSIKQLLAGEVDLAILALPVAVDGLQVVPLFSEELLVVMPPDHRLANKPKLFAKDIGAEPFVLLAEAHCLSEQVAGFCQRKRFQPVVTERASQLLTVQELVSLGHGVSLIPAMARFLDKSPRRVYRSLAGEPPTRTVAMAWRGQRFQTQAVKRFIEATRAFAEDWKPGVGGE